MPEWWWLAKLPDTVTPLDVADTARLKQVLFGGEPWLIQCYSGLPYAGQHLPYPFRAHKVFTESLGSLRGLVRRTQPLLIFAADGGKPKQVPSASAGSAYAVTAWVKPKAEPTVHAVKSQQQLYAACGGRQMCLVTMFDSDSAILQQLALRFRTVKMVSLGEKGKLSWGRGDEVGETLEEDEARHLGKRVSLLAPDPDAPPKKGKKPEPLPPRLLRGHGGEEDLPSLSRFLTRAVEKGLAEDDRMSTLLPQLVVPEKKKKSEPKESRPNDNAEVQARRAKKRREERAAEEAAQAAQEAEQEAQNAELQRKREQQRRARMAQEEEQAGNIIEEVEEEDDEDDSAIDVEEEEDYEEDALDLDM